jgi:hypothetical protein
MHAPHAAFADRHALHAVAEAVDARHASMKPEIWVGVHRFWAKGAGVAVKG